MKKYYTDEEKKAEQKKKCDELVGAVMVKYNVAGVIELAGSVVSKFESDCQCSNGFYMNANFIEFVDFMRAEFGCHSVRGNHIASIIKSSDMLFSQVMLHCQAWGPGAYKYAESLFAPIMDYRNAVRCAEEYANSLPNHPSIEQRLEQIELNLEILIGLLAPKQEQRRL